jgi:hypothetical protein
MQVIVIRNNSEIKDPMLICSDFYAKKETFHPKILSTVKHCSIEHMDAQ